MYKLYTPRITAVFLLCMCRCQIDPTCYLFVCTTLRKCAFFKFKIRCNWKCNTSPNTIRCDLHLGLDPLCRKHWSKSHPFPRNTSRPAQHLGLDRVMWP